jgi:branched-chain amino acid transport system permease protein
VYAPTGSKVCRRSVLTVPLAEVTNTSVGEVHAGALRLIMFGGLLLLATLALPKGIIPSISQLLERRRRGETSSLTGARLADTALPTAPMSDRAALVGSRWVDHNSDRT